MHDWKGAEGHERSFRQFLFVDAGVLHGQTTTAICRRSFRRSLFTETGVLHDRPAAAGARRSFRRCLLQKPAFCTPREPEGNPDWTRAFISLVSVYRHRRFARSGDSVLQRTEPDGGEIAREGERRSHAAAPRADNKRTGQTHRHGKTAPHSGAEPFVTREHEPLPVERSRRAWDGRTARPEAS